MENGTKGSTEELEVQSAGGKEPGKKKTWIKVLKYGFLVLVAIFLARYFYENADTYRNLNVTIHWPVFAGAVGFYFLYKITLACGII